MSNRGDDLTEKVGRSVGVVIVAFGVNLLYAFILMLLLGSLHHDYWPAVPAASVWQCLAFFYAVRGLVVRGPMKTKVEKR